ncbi:hypothetical protein ACHAXR_011420 [Thalassiosira sp. AJA248-18]
MRKKFAVPTKRAIRDCVANLSKTFDDPIDYKVLKKFPKNYSDAYEHVLRNDEVSDQIFCCSDKLNGGGYLEPFFRCHDRRTGAFTGYKLKNEYQGFSSRELDPLYRFQFDEISNENLFYQRWFVDEDDASADGVLFEAMLACHALQYEPCYDCKCLNALRWNGGGSASWQDMICIKCGATYEIKTKASMEKVENALHWNNLNGGSFSSWCRLRNSKQPNQKMYLVLLPRKSTFNRHHEKVLPKICSNSFNTNHNSIRFKSSVSLKLNTKAKWFNLPITGEVIEMGQIAVKVFKERFSEEKYERLRHLYFGSDSSDGDETSDKVEEKEAADHHVDDIINELKKVEIVPDDWEDLASDSD